MSILLEALRKTEKSQRQSKPPGIDDDMPAATARPRTRYGLWAVMVVLAVALSGWFIWQQYRPPKGYQPPVSLPAGTRTPVEKPLAAAPAQQGTKTTQWPAAPARRAAAPAQKPEGSQRTPVESFQPPPAPKAAAAGGVKPVPSAEAGRMDEVLAAAKQAAATAQKPAADTRPKPKPEPAQSKEFVPDEPAPISYWELPDAVRAQVPEIKFTVLVYSTHPKDRFVLIDGQRLVEGDRLPSGPKIVEIRLDGVVFSYRLYHFLVRTGSG